MGKNNKKRKHAQYEQDNDQSHDFGLATTLAHLKAPLSTKDASTPESKDSMGGAEDEGWTKVTKSFKRRSNKQQRKEREFAESRREVVRPKDTKKKKNNYPAVTYAALHTFRSSIKLIDLQNLLLYCLADGTAPQWLSVRHHDQIRKAVVLFVPGLEKGMFDGSIALPDAAPDEATASEATEPGGIRNGSPQKGVESHVANSNAKLVITKSPATGVSPDEFLPSTLRVDDLPEPLRPLAGIFEHRWPVKAPGDEKFSKVYSPLHSMLTSPMPKTREEKEEEKRIKGAKPAREGKYWDNKPTPITAFINSNEDLLENEYSLHPTAFATDVEQENERSRRKAANETAEDGWVDTDIEKLEDADVANFPKGSLTAGRTVLAMDCEMCLVERGESALTRISIVGWDGTVVMDELVKPDKPIIDYLTPYSGITPAALAPVTTTLPDIQTRLFTLITPQTIIVGHSLNSDLKALKLTHPFIIDTSLVYPHPRGPPLKASLKWLAQKYLTREIQKGHGATGHNSIEDARACLDLVRLKCEKGPQWGSSDANREPIFKRLSRVAKAGCDGGRKGAIVDHGAPERNYGQMATCAIGCASDADVVEGVRRAVLGDEDGKVVPGGGVELTWARLRELEILRGWVNDYRSNPSSNSLSHPTPDPSPKELSAAVARTVQHIKAIYEFLPPCTLLMVYTGTGDPRPLARLQDLQRRFQEEYKVKKWDELSVKWTDRENMAMREAARGARAGLGFVVVSKAPERGGGEKGGEGDRGDEESAGDEKSGEVDTGDGDVVADVQAEA